MLSLRYPKAMAGRANAAINVFGFIGMFSGQWGIVTPSSAPKRSPGTSPMSPRRSWRTSTRTASSGSAPKSVPGDYLVGKVTPKGETELPPEERLLRGR